MTMPTIYQTMTISRDYGMYRDQNSYQYEYRKKKGVKNKYRCPHSRSICKYDDCGHFYPHPHIPECTRDRRDDCPPCRRENESRH